MLFFVGLGLGDAKDITVKGLEVVKKCKRVYLEAYTSILTVGKDALVWMLLHYTVTYDNVMYYFKSVNSGLYSYRGIYVSTIFTHLKKYTIINYDTMYQLGQLET